MRGDSGPRSGMILKKGELIVGGNTGYMSGFMMQNGRMIVCGDADTGLGDSMYQGVIFLGGTAKELGSGLEEVDAENGELDEGGGAARPLRDQGAPKIPQAAVGPQAVALQQA